MKIKAVLVCIVVMVVNIPGLVMAQEPQKPYGLIISDPVDGSLGVGGLMQLDDQAKVRVLANLTKFDGDDIEGTQIGVNGGYMMFLGADRVSPYLVAGADIQLFLGDLGDARDNEVGAFGGLGVMYEVTPGFSLMAEGRLSLTLTPDFLINTTTTNIAAVFHF